MPEKLFQGDQRLETLMQAILELLYERGEGMPIPSIVGVLELAKLEILKEQGND